MTRRIRPSRPKGGEKIGKPAPAWAPKSGLQPRDGQAGLTRDTENSTGRGSAEAVLFENDTAPGHVRVAGSSWQQECTVLLRLCGLAGVFITVSAPTASLAVALAVTGAVAALANPGRITRWLYQVAEVPAAITAVVEASRSERSKWRAQGAGQAQILSFEDPDLRAAEPLPAPVSSPDVRG